MEGINLQDGEIVKPIPGYEKFYLASNFGRIFSLNYRRTGKIAELAQSSRYDKRRSNDTMYRRVKAYFINKNTPTPVHRLVAITFIPNPNNHPQVNHIDGDKGNNNADNLEWVTVQMNNRHAEDAGLSKHYSGEKHHSASLSDDQVLEIRKRISDGYYRGIGVDLAKEYGVSVSVVSNIKTGKTWSYLL